MALGDRRARVRRQTIRADQDVQVAVAHVAEGNGADARHEFLAGRARCGVARQEQLRTPAQPHRRPRPLAPAPPATAHARAARARVFALASSCASALPPSAGAASKAVVRTVMTLTESALFTVASALIGTILGAIAVGRPADIAEEKNRYLSGASVVYLRGDR